MQPGVLRHSPQWDWGLLSRISPMLFHGHCVWSLRGAMAMAKDRRSVCIAAYRGLLLHAGDSSFEFVSFRVTTYIVFSRPLTPIHSY